ncbi:MAG: hypothetical protein JNL90_06970 [Planctomycetes bacterium]|nr:hypothetical protein [Planctomycetota bacterium]
MLHPGSNDRDAALSLQALAEEPELLEPGLKVIDVGLRLTPGVELDLVLADREGRAVVVLGEGSGGADALLGRSLCVLADIRRMWHLLDRLFPSKGVTFGTDPRLVLVARRFSDALHGAVDLFGPLAIEMVEARDVVVDGTSRLVLFRVGGTSAAATGAAMGRSANSAAASAPGGGATSGRATSGERAAAVAEEARKR